MSAILITPATPLDRDDRRASPFEYEPESATQPHDYHHSALEFERQPLILEPDTPVTPEVPRDMGYDEQFVKPEGRRGDVIAQWAALISVGVFLVSTWVIVLSNNPRSLGLFFFHPILQSLAISMFTYGILTLQPTSQAKTKAAGLTRHQLAMGALGVPAIVLGSLAIIANKAIHESPHFKSWHGTLGVISLVWLVAQVVVGGGSVWFGGRLFGGGRKAKLLWKYHRLSGYVLFPLFLLTAYLGGAWSDWTTTHSPFVLRLFAYTIAPVVLIAALVVRIRTSKMQFA